MAWYATHHTGVLGVVRKQVHGTLPGKLQSTEEISGGIMNNVTIFTLWCKYFPIQYTELQWIAYTEFRSWIREQFLGSTRPCVLFKNC